MKKIISGIIISLIILVGFTTIAKAETEEKVFSISDAEKELGLNSTTFLYCRNIPTGEEVVWTTSNPEVVTVDEKGNLAGISIGTATITATAGEATASCKISVVYKYMNIEGNSGFKFPINLILGEHEIEQLDVEVQDGKYEKVENPIIKFISSDANVATVDGNGLITAKTVGQTTITATAAGLEETIEIKVYGRPEFTDFSNAKYETFFDVNASLKISNITPKNETTVNYYLVITPDNVKPEGVITGNGTINYESPYKPQILGVNQEESYLYDNFIDEHVERNQDLYVWVLESQKLEDYYYNEAEEIISYSTKYVVEGQKIGRPELPKLNAIIHSFSLGKYHDENNEEYKYTRINFRIPSVIENRKFRLKIGRVTNKTILQKIKNNDYEGITELLKYAKENKSIYEKELTTTSGGYYKIEDVLFDGKTLLEDDAYYFIYAIFDDENGKYYPIEGVTLGQAWHYDENNYWELWAYNDEKFEWTDLSSGTEPKPDGTEAPNPLPQTGLKTIFGITAIALIGIMVFLKSKDNYYKNI